MREIWEPRPSSPSAIDSKSFFPLSEASLCLKEAGERQNRKRARGDGNEKKKQDRGSRLFCLPISHRFLIHFIFIIFLNTQREPLQRREPFFLFRA